MLTSAFSKTDVYIDFFLKKPMLSFYLNLQTEKPSLFSRSSVSRKPTLLILPDPPRSLLQRHPQVAVITAIVPDPQR